MNRFQRSWLLLKTSLSVIGHNKELVIFPLVSFVCTAVIILFFLAPSVLRPTGHAYTSAEHWQAISHSLFTNAGNNGNQTGFTPAAVAYLAFLYVLAMFIATFCNVAFYHEILGALNGEPVSIGRGLKFAGTRLGPILMWTLFAGVVGLIIKTIEQRFSLVGRIIARLLGTVWSVAAVFVIPVIVRQEGANPVAALQKSAGILRRTWGEALIGYAGLSFVNLVLFLGSIASLVMTIVFASMVHLYFIVPLAVAGWLLGMFVWGYVSNVASHVYRGALYMYAAEGTVPQPYTAEILNLAWKYRK